MPVYDMGYRKWEGKLHSRVFRWAPIFRQEILGHFQKRRFYIFLVIIWLQLFIRGGLLYLKHSDPRLAQFLQLGPDFYLQFLDVQIILVIILGAIVGSGLIARDRATHGLEIYLSKPVKKVDYLVGKTLAVFVFFLYATLLPSLVLYLIDVLFSPDTGYLSKTSEYLWWIFAYSMLISGVSALLAAAVSSLTKSVRFAGIIWFVLFLFTQILYKALKDILDDPRMFLLSLAGNFRQIGAAIFGTGDPAGTGWEPAAVILTGVALLSLAVLFFRFWGAGVKE